MTKRPPTYGDRGEFRRATPRGVEALPEYVCEDITGKYEGEDLAVARSRRPTDARIARLEDKHDALVATVGEMGQALGRVEGKLDVLPQLVTAVKEASDRVQQREHVTFTAQVEVDKATKLDVLDARRLRRRFALKVIGLLGAGGVVAEIAHWLIGRLS